MTMINTPSLMCFSAPAPRITISWARPDYDSEGAIGGSRVWRFPGKAGDRAFDTVAFPGRTSIMGFWQRRWASARLLNPALGKQRLRLPIDIPASLRYREALEWPGTF